ncbi:MAG: carboxypeptidase regulatory-like domain-containing protein, partial [Acidobacteria bacterium]|nr:carboxypeptidase regulatory-like domain-containing protein [Acidobacteriota bacterium]
MKFRNLALAALGVLFLAFTSFAQTTQAEGDVKGEDGQPLKGALVKIERKDIRGNYKVKTDKKGHYLHAGLPSGVYRLTLEVDGKDVDMVDNVRLGLNDPPKVDFDLQAAKKRRDALQAAAEAGTLSKDQERAMSPEERAAMEKTMKAREEAIRKNKALSDSYNSGMVALEGKNYQEAVDQFIKAAEVDPKQAAVWTHMADAYAGLSKGKTGAEFDAAMQKCLDAWSKSVELAPSDPAIHNNYALALVQAHKIPDAQAELVKAAQLDPPHAGQYYYNLGAVLTNAGQIEPATEAFKKAMELNWAEAFYQYGVVLIGKATVDASGKMVPPPGTTAAFEK